MYRAMLLFTAVLSALAQDSAKDKAIQWMKDNNRWTPDAPIVVGFVKELEEVITGGKDCQWSLGAGLTKAAKPFLLAWHSGQFFAIELTATQATALEIASMSRTMQRQGDARESGPPAEPLATLSAAEIKDAAALAPTQAITGKLSFRRERIQAEDVAIRLSFRRATRGTTSTVEQWHYVAAQLVEAGEIDFQFQGIESDDGPVLVFITLYAVPNPKESTDRKAVSNTVAVVLNIAK